MKLRLPFSIPQIAPLLVILLTSCVSTAPQDDSYGFASYVSGQHARSESDVTDAARYYVEALRAAPQNEVLLQDSFSLMLTTGQYSDAVDLAKRMQAVGLDNGVASMLLSLEYFKDKRFDRAMAALESAHGTGFDSLVAPLVRAWVDASLGKTDQAISELDPLAQISVFEPFYKEHRAYILDFARRDDDAEKAFKEILADEPISSLQPVLALGALLQRQDRRDEALALYQHYIDAFGQNRFLVEAVDRLQGRQRPINVAGSPDGALSSALLRAATQLSQDNAITPAIIYARLASFLSPDADEVYMLIGNLFLAQEEPKIALLAYAEVDQDSDLIKMARIREALAYDQLGETDRGLAILDDFLSENPTDGDARSTKGDILRSHERFEEAAVEYTQAIDALGEPNTSDWFLFFTRGIAFEQTDQWPRAEADFLKALELLPDEPQVLNYLGYSWIDRGMHIERAKGMIEKAVEQRPNDGFIIDSLGWVQFLLGDYSSAVENLERAILLEPDDPTINDHLGDAYWMVGRQLEARFQWNHALSLDPEENSRAKIADKIGYGLSAAPTAPNDDAGD